MEQSQPDQIIEKLFNAHFHSLVFDSFRILKDYEQAQDLVQDVFVKIWQNFEKVKHISNLKAYLHTAVRNSSYNYVRDQKFKQNKIEINDAFDHADNEDENRLHNEDVYDKIHEAVSKLPQNWQEAFILSKYEKLKYYEIAKRMKISDKTVEKYISKSLAFIRLELKNIIIFILLLFYLKKP